jgi:hypothetical protein
MKEISKWKTKTISANSTNLTINALKKGKRYQVQVRAYKTVGSVKYYGAWSSENTSKTVK